MAAVLTILLFCSSFVFILPFSILLERGTRFKMHQVAVIWARLLILSNPLWNLTVEGRENMDPKKQYVVVGNHQSLLDILVTLAGVIMAVVILNNNGVYKGTDVNPKGGDVAPTVFVKDARYEKLMEAFGGVGVYATTPAELRKGMEEAIRSRKPTLINAVIDETAGTESGRITSLNPSAKKK